MSNSIGRFRTFEHAKTGASAKATGCAWRPRVRGRTKDRVGLAGTDYGHADDVPPLVDPERLTLAHVGRRARVPEERMDSRPPSFGPPDDLPSVVDVERLTLVRAKGPEVGHPPRLPEE